MAATKKYFHDRTVLLMLSANAFLALSVLVLVLVRLNSTHGNAYIAQYRASLGINAFKTGSLLDLLSFILFAFLIFGIHTTLSYKTYTVNKHLSTVILGLGMLLLVMTIIISNALLVLH